MVYHSVHSSLHFSQHCSLFVYGLWSIFNICTLRDLNPWFPWLQFALFHFFVDFSHTGWCSCTGAFHVHNMCCRQPPASSSNSLDFTELNLVLCDCSWGPLQPTEYAFPFQIPRSVVTNTLTVHSLWARLQSQLISSSHYWYRLCIKKHAIISQWLIPSAYNSMHRALPH